MANVHQLLKWANKREVARELTRRGFDVSGETLNRWVREQREVPAVVERMVLNMYGLAGNGNEAPPAEASGAAPEWAVDLQQSVQAIITRDEVNVLVGEVEGRVTSEIQTNREAIIEALAGDFVDAAMRRLAQTPDGARLLESVGPLPEAEEQQPEQEPSDVR